LGQGERSLLAEAQERIHFCRERQRVVVAVQDAEGGTLTWDLLDADVPTSARGICLRRLLFHFDGIHAGIVDVRDERDN
jgi:hypothetical protein